MRPLPTKPPTDNPPLVITGPGGQYVNVYRPKPSRPMFTTTSTPIGHYGRMLRWGAMVVLRKIGRILKGGAK